MRVRPTPTQNPVASSPKAATTQPPPTATPTAPPPTPQERNETQAYPQWEPQQVTSFADIPNGVDAALAPALAHTQSWLQILAEEKPETLRQIFEQALGNKLTPAQFDHLLQQAKDMTLPLPPRIRLAELPEGVQGAYQADKGGSILISERLRSQPEALQHVLLEEWGHHLDAQLGGPDSPGDEGQILAEGLYASKPLDAARLTELQGEDDHGQIAGEDVEFNRMREINQQAQQRRLAEVPAMLQKYKNTRNLQEKARLMADITFNMGLISMPDVVYLRNQLKRFGKPGGPVFTGSERKKFMDSLEFAMKKSEAFRFTEPGFFPNVAKLVQLADIEVLKSFSDGLKTKILDSMDHMIEKGGAQEDIAVAAATISTTLVDVLVPNNALDVAGASKGVLKAFRQSPEIAKAISQLCKTKIDNAWVLSKDPKTGKYLINYTQINKLNPAQRQLMVGLKIDEMHRARNKAEAQAIAKDLQKLLLHQDPETATDMMKYALNMAFGGSTGYSAVATLEAMFAHGLNLPPGHTRQTQPYAVPKLP